jgi:hypothetical protein
MNQYHSTQRSWRSESKEFTLRVYPIAPGPEGIEGTRKRTILDQNCPCSINFSIEMMLLYAYAYNHCA